MLSIDIPIEVEKQFRDVVQKHYHGNIQIAFISLLHLQEKYGWKEQLLQDVETIRTEVRRHGGISAKVIDETIRKYRKTRQ